MASAVTKYQDNAGKLFDTEAEADASNAKLANHAKVEEFVKVHFPTRANSRRGNPHAGTASKAIYMWIAAMESGQPYTLDT